MRKDCEYPLTASPSPTMSSETVYALFENFILISSSYVCLCVSELDNGPRFETLPLWTFRMFHKPVGLISRSSRRSPILTANEARLKPRVATGAKECPTIATSGDICERGKGSMGVAYGNEKPC